MCEINYPAGGALSVGQSAAAAGGVGMVQGPVNLFQQARQTASVGRCLAQSEGHADVDTGLARPVVDLLLDAAELGLRNVLQGATLAQAGQGIQTAVQFQRVATAFNAARQEIDRDKDDGAQQVDKQQPRRELRTRGAGLLCARGCDGTPGVISGRWRVVETAL